MGYGRGERGSGRCKAVRGTMAEGLGEVQERYRNGAGRFRGVWRVREG